MPSMAPDQWSRVLPMQLSAGAARTVRRAAKDRLPTTAIPTSLLSTLAQPAQ
jgi:hypothetical protein